jgi:chaperonin GroEL
MPKDLLYGNDARTRVLSGVSKLAKTVAVTMGPQGKNVIVGKGVGAPTITKDGVSVAREVVLEDPVEELGCQLVKEAAGRTADLAGDGTTTATVLAHEIFSRGKELIDKKYSTLHFRDGFNWGLNAILLELDKLSKPIDSDETLKNIAIISTNNDADLGGKIADAYILVNRTGMVTAEAVPGAKNSARVVDGIELRSGFASPGFLEKGQSKCVMNNCHILISDSEITHMADQDALKFFTQFASENKSILVISKDIKKEGLAFFLANHTHGRMRACAIKTPSFGKRNDLWLEDLAMLVGATIIGEESGIPISKLSQEHLGFAERIEIGSYSTKITGPRKDAERIRDRVETYNIDLQKLIGEFEIKDIKDRKAFLSSTASIITVGYSTELELREKGDRVEDAMSAVKAAIEEGFVPGGGFALLRAAQNVDISNAKKEHLPAIQILLDSCSKPARQILENSNLEPEEIFKKIVELQATSDSFLGYNSATGEYGDLIEMGIVDPKKVTRLALQNAASIALLLITTDAVIAENPNKESGWQPPAGWRPPSDTNLNHKH